MANKRDKIKKIKILTKKAKTFYDKKKWDQTIDVLSEALVIAKSDSSISIDLKDDIYPQRGRAYLKKGEYDLAITDFSKHLELSPNCSAVYHSRGYAYFKKGENDLAIADYNKSLKLKPKYSLNYNGRGHAYLEKNEYDLAIADFNKLLEIEPNYSGVYHCRAYAYFRKGKYDLVIGDLNKLLELEPKSYQALNNRGHAYHHKGEYDMAIADYNKSLELESNNDAAYYYLGISHYFTHKYLAALNDFKRAIKLKPSLIYENFLCYIVSHVSTPPAFEYLCELYRAVYNIKSLLIYKPKEHQKEVVAHYADLDTLKKIVQKNKFRLYNVSYMNDLEEGKSLFKIIPNSKNYNFENKFYSDESSQARSMAYVGSFVRVSKNVDEQENEDGKLSLWRLYGKDEGKEAGGACLSFDISRFSEKPPLEFGQMQFLPTEDDFPHPMSEMPQEEYMYKVVYKSKLSDYKGLQPSLNKLSKTLNDIVEKEWNEKDEVYSLTRELLDEIRFLFKADDYKEEKELRIVQSRYSFRIEQQNKNKNIKKEDDKVEIDVDNFPPRFYVESQQLKLKKVILGPQTQHIAEWKKWIKRENSELEVNHSDIPFGNPTL